MLARVTTPELSNISPGFANSRSTLLRIEFSDLSCNFTVNYFILISYISRKVQTLPLGHFQACLTHLFGMSYMYINLILVNVAIIVIIQDFTSSNRMCSTNRETVSSLVFRQELPRFCLSRNY